MSQPLSQVSWTRELLHFLWHQGIREVCVCAGSRNAPFVELLSTVQDLRVWWGFEERSAAFFALGRARALHQPVAVVTTSGTAVAELLPATIEAYHSAVPLVLITCDRPRALVGTGAPQTINQGGILAQFAQAISVEPDATGLEEITTLAWQRPAPIHINIHLDEPLLDEPELCGQSWSAGESAQLPAVQTSQIASIQRTDEAPRALAELLRGSSHPLVLVGPLAPHEAKVVAPVLARLGVPVWAEATSQLREEQSIRHLSLGWGEHSARADSWDGIIRVGGVPTSRLWRDLERNEIPLISFAAPPYWPGMSRLHPIFPLEVLQEISQIHSAGCDDGIHRDRDLAARIEILFERFPCAEPSVVRRLSMSIADGSKVYLGNSLPIRVWDWAAVKDRRWTYGCNRGANGIDGQLSTFLGWSESRRENWAIVGDLTALYDIAALWYARSMPSELLRIVVVNNGGGQIFSHIYRNPAYVNAHDVQFRAMAELWGWGYSVWDGSGDLPALTRQHILEVQVDEAHTRAFYAELRSTFSAELPRVFSAELRRS